MQLINVLEKSDATVRKTTRQGESFLSHKCVSFAHEWKDGAVPVISSVDGVFTYKFFLLQICTGNFRDIVVLQSVLKDPKKNAV